MNELSYVWLEDAFAWTCEGCKRRNRAEWVPEELDSETIDELRKEEESI